MNKIWDDFAVLYDDANVTYDGELIVVELKGGQSKKKEYINRYIFFNLRGFKKFFNENKLQFLGLKRFNKKIICDIDSYLKLIKTYKQNIIALKHFNINKDVNFYGIKRFNEENIKNFEGRKRFTKEEVKLIIGVLKTLNTVEKNLKGIKRYDNNIIKKILGIKRSEQYNVKDIIGEKDYTNLLLALDLLGD